MNMSRLLKLGDRNKSAIFVIVLAVAIAINILIQPFGLRLDLSKNQAYTLSNASKKVVRGVNNKVKLSFYVSKDLPTRLAPFKTQITDLLNEYKRAGGNNVTVEVKDPKTDDKAREDAVKNGITEVRFSQLEQDKFNVSTGYFGLLISYNGQQKAIPQLTDIDNLEYNITSSIYTLSRKDTPKVGLIGRDTDVSVQNGDPIGGIRQLLSQQFTVENIALTSPAPPADPNSDLPTPTSAPNVDIDPAYKAVMVFDSPPKKYSDEEINKIKQYLKKKGNAIVFMNGIQVDEQLIATQEATSNLNSLTQDYGIKVNKNFVLSADAELINFGTGVTQFFIPYPFWLKTSTYDTSAGFFSNVGTLTFPWASTLSISEKAGVTVKDIIRTNDRSWVQDSKIDLDPQKAANKVPENLSQYVIGAVATNKQGGTLLVIPSSRFALNSYQSQQSGNLNFLLNVINNFVSEGALTGIRQRAVDTYPLPALSDNDKNLFKYGTMLVLPILFAAFGGYYLWKRK